MNLERAIAIATKAHEGQFDKGGNSYIEHPLHVMSKMNTVEEKIVAVLHDVVEDTNVTLEDLKKEGFSSEIIEGIDSVTRRKDETYKEFILRAKENTIGREVKIQDLLQNKDLSRIHNPTEADFSRIKRYDDALLALGEII